MNMNRSYRLALVILTAAMLSSCVYIVAIPIAAGGRSAQQLLMIKQLSLINKSSAPNLE